MSVMTLSSLYKTGEFVSSQMFGANAVFEHTDDGAPTTAYAQAADALGVQNIRFGGGQADLDPRKANAAGEVPVEGVNAINIVSMPDGALGSELVSFLDWCVETTEKGHPTQATLIIPTKHLNTQDYTAFASKIEVFVKTVMQKYGDMIAAFQIGNEYWEMGETAYGIKASLAVEAAERGLIAAGVAEADQPDLLVQMGTAGNNGSEFPAVAGISDFVARNKAANNQIIDQLSEKARAAIDGVTEHYYYNKSGYAFDAVDAGVKNINRDFAVWSDRLDRDLDLHITEWNVKTSATEQHGMVAASSMIKQFENMIALGVDGAHVWALDYHSRTALTLDTDDGVRLDEQGRLINSAQGAAFDLMADALIGKELVSSSFSNGIPGITVSSYASDEEMVFYISLRSMDKQEFTLDIASKLLTGNPVTAVKIAMDAESSNGKQWERGESADSVLIGGKPYFYNEHDVDVTLTNMVFEDASQIALDLNPFEVVQLTVSLGDAPDGTSAFHKNPVKADKEYFRGDDGDNLILLTQKVVYIDSGAGMDTVIVDGLSSDATISFDNSGKPVLSTPGYAPQVILANVEKVAFNDDVLLLDQQVICGPTLRVYETVSDGKTTTQSVTYGTERSHEDSSGVVNIIGNSGDGFWS